jgi:hypothetical protein
VIVVDPRKEAEAMVRIVREGLPVFRIALESDALAAIEHADWECGAGRSAARRSSLPPQAVHRSEKKSRLDSIR